MAASKKPASLLIGIGKGEDEDMGEDVPEAGADDESTEDFDSAASELLAAVKASDESAFKESLRACIMSVKG